MGVSPVADRPPAGITLVLTRIARSLGLLTLGGYVVLVLEVDPEIRTGS